VSESFAERAIAEIDPARLRRSGADSDRPRALARRALSRGGARASGLAPSGGLARRADVAVIISDASRDEPRSKCSMRFSRSSLAGGDARGRVGNPRDDGSVVPERHRDLPLIVHDAGQLDRMVTLERPRAEPRSAAARSRRRRPGGGHEPDQAPLLRRLLGRHEGYFPASHRDDALANHLLKAEPSARLGRVDDNVCRLDMEKRRCGLAAGASC
jgi:hypothetical protein